MFKKKDFDDNIKKNSLKMVDHCIRNSNIY